MTHSFPQDAAPDEQPLSWDDLEFIPYVVGFSAIAASWRHWRERRRGRPRLRDRLRRRAVRGRQV